MGKVFFLCIAIAVGYAIGYRDARNHSDHIVTRVVEKIGMTFGKNAGNDVDAIMSKVEGKS
jgi:hypothetical protein